MKKNIFFSFFIHNFILYNTNFFLYFFNIKKIILYINKNTNYIKIIKKLH